MQNFLVHLLSRDGLPRLGLEQFGPIALRQESAPPLSKLTVVVSTHSCLLSESPRQYTNISRSNSKAPRDAKNIYPVAAWGFLRNNNRDKALPPAWLEHFNIFGGSY